MIYQAGQLIEKGTIKKVVEKNEETFWPLVRLIPDKKNENPLSILFKWLFMIPLRR